MCQSLATTTLTIEMLITSHFEVNYEVPINNAILRRVHLRQNLFFGFSGNYICQQVCVYAWVPLLIL